LRGGRVGKTSKEVLSPKGEEDIQGESQESRQVDCERQAVREIPEGTRRDGVELRMSDVPIIEKAAPLAKGAQILQLVKDNQLVTAAIVFVLWQAGALAEALAYAGC